MKKIVIIALNTGIGNVLMTTPLIKKTKKKYPSSIITVLVSNNSCKQVLEKNPFIDKIIIIPKKENFLERFIPLSGMPDLFLLRKKRFDISITIMPHAYYSSFASIIINAKKRISHKLCLLDIFQNRLIKLKKVHDVQQNLYLIDNQIEKDIHLELYLDKKDSLKKIKNSIGIHPGCDSNSYLKRWPINKFNYLSKILLKKGYKIFFFLGPQERELKKYITKEKNIKIFDNLPLNETIKKINQCEYFISNDSGISHIAEALDIPLVVIFGPSDYRRSGPIKKNRVIIVKPSKYNPWIYTLEDIFNEKKINKSNFMDMERVSVKKVYKSLIKLKKRIKKQS